MTHETVEVSYQISWKYGGQSIYKNSTKDAHEALAQYSIAKKHQSDSENSPYKIYDIKFTKVTVVTTSEDLSSMANEALENTKKILGE